MKKFFEWYFRRAFGWLFGNDGENLINPLSATSSVTDNLNKNYGEIDSPSGFFSKIFGGNSFADFLAAVSNRISAEHMTGADVEAANMSYAQQEKFFNDYQSIPAQVQQSVEAGLNPALMYGRGASPASPISGSANASQPSLDPGQLLSSLTSIMFRAKEVSAEQNLKNAQANYYNKVASKVGMDVDTYQERYQFWKQIQSSNILHINAQTFTEYAKEALARQEISESEARTTLLNFQGLIAQNGAKWADTLNNDLHEVRQTAKDLNISGSWKNWSAKDLTDEQRYQLQNTFSERLDILRSDMRKAAADAGISEQEFNAFWSKYRLEELVTIGQVFDDFKGNFSVLGIGGTHNSFQMPMFDNGMFNPFGLPSLTP